MKKIAFLFVAAICLISSCKQYRIYPPPSWIIPDNSEPVEIFLSETELSLEKDGKHQLTASFNPESTSADLLWISSDERILTVDSNGLITAIGTGEATITVMVSNNLSISAICNVSVYDILLQEDQDLATLLEEKGLKEATTLSIAGTLFNTDFKTLREMTSLQHLDISDISNTTIPQTAFYQACFSTIELPENLKTIEEWAFENSSITELDIPDGVTEIQDSAFMNCYELQKLTIPGSVETIGRWIIQSSDDYGEFPDNIETVEVVIEEGVKNLSLSSFYGAAIKSIKVPTTITEIPNFCFAYSLLESIELHDKITSIDDCAFYYTNLHSIDLPENLETIGSDAFVGVNILDQQGALIIPGSVKSIGARAFSSTGITSVVFNEGLETISDAAFANIDFTSIVLPSSLKNLGDSAFDQYDSIKSITFKSAPPSIIYTTGVSGLYAPSLTGIENCIVYVKPEYLDEYKASVWFSGTDAYIDYGYTYKDYFSEDNLLTIES